jgi:hypothetical protein
MILIIVARFKCFPLAPTDSITRNLSFATTVIKVTNKKTAPVRAKVQILGLKKKTDKKNQ